MKVLTISSGSKGNSTLIMCDGTNILIDVGITPRQLKQRLEINSLSIDMIDAVLITHCHKDHTSGLASLIKKTNLNIFIKEEMYDSLKELVPKENCVFIDDKFKINDVEIDIIKTSHDAPSSCGYIISHNNKKILYITDTGYINRKYNKISDNLDMYLIESNHDEKMLMEGPYPPYLKSRVLSDEGHLSNNAAANFLKKVIGDKTRYIYLLHLSETNNDPNIAKKTVEEKINNENIEVLVAPQYETGRIIEI